jgi:hypothetical protein
MNISKVHASMINEIRPQGPLVNAQTGLRSRHNRGVRRAWKRIKRQEAEQRHAKATDRRLLTRVLKEASIKPAGDDPFNGMTVGEFRELADEFHQSQGFI